MQTPSWPLLILILYSLAGHHQHTSAMEQPQDQSMKIIAWVAATVGTQALGQRLAHSQFSQTLEAATNLTLHDITATCTLSTSLIAASYFFSEDRKAKIQHFAVRFPIASLLAKLITSKLVKQSTQHMPVVHWYLGCPNSQCTGLCNSCAVRNMVIFTGLMRMIV